jgi:hypothetical protein
MTNINKIINWMIFWSLLPIVLMLLGYLSIMLNFPPIITSILFISGLIGILNLMVQLIILYIKGKREEIMHPNKKNDDPKIIQGVKMGKMMILFGVGICVIYLVAFLISSLFNMWNQAYQYIGWIIFIFIIIFFLNKKYKKESKKSRN